jgi:hypothetical protein
MIQYIACRIGCEAARVFERGVVFIGRARRHGDHKGNCAQQ